MTVLVWNLPVKLHKKRTWCVILHVFVGVPVYILHITNPVCFHGAWCLYLIRNYVQTRFCRLSCIVSLHTIFFPANTLLQENTDQQSSKYYQKPRTCFSKSNFWSIPIPQIHLPCVTLSYVSHRLSLTSGKKISTASELLSHNESVCALSLTANEIPSVSFCMVFIFTQAHPACAALNGNYLKFLYTW